VLFAALQHDAAAEVGISRTVVVALQNTGGGIGNMLAVLNIAAVCGVIRMTGMEGAIMRKALVPTLLFGVCAGLAGMLLTWALPGMY
jgi:lactate permease